MLCVYRRAAGAVRSANEVARSVSTMVRAISSWIANTSARVRSYRSDQSSWPSSVDVSWAEIRRRSPARRTVPSSTQAAPSRAPMARTSCGFPLSANTDVRDATRSPSTPARAAISSSVMPSLRYSFSGSGLALANGRTAMQRTAAEAVSPDPAAAPSPLRPDGAQRPGGLGHLLRHGGPRAAAAQRRLASQHLVDHARQAVEVAPASQILLAARLLRAHVLRRPQRQPALGHHFHADLGEGARDTKVGEHRVEVREQDVLGLHVAMDEALAMRVVEGHAHV